MPEIKLTAPTESPSWCNLDVFMPYLEHLVPILKEGLVLNKQQALLAASYLLANPNLLGFYLKAMQLEHVPHSQRGEGYWKDPVMALQILDRAIAHALYMGVPGQVVLDHFSQQFDNGHFHWNQLRPQEYPKSHINYFAHSSLLHYESKYRYFSAKIVNYSATKSRPLKALQALTELNLHGLADALPWLLVNILRNHDHRKGMIFTFADSELFLLHTFNFDRPLDLDCALVIQDPEIIAAAKSLYDQELPTNEIIQASGWSLYQDGVADLDPKSPDSSSPILSRVQELLYDRTTKQLLWCSQFLPDQEELHSIRERLAAGSLETATVLSPAPHFWSNLYRFSGGRTSLKLIRSLQKQFPDQFSVHFSDQQYPHAKILVVNQGERFLIGSHNFNRQLVKARTVEIALELQQIPAITHDSLLHTLQGTFPQLTSLS